MDALIYRVSIRRLRYFFDPFKDDLWNRGATITLKEVQHALQEQRLDPRPNGWDLRLRLEDDVEARARYDVERIAYLVHHPAADPISIDVRSEHDVSLDDGGHRLAAAIVRQERQITVVVGGDLRAFTRRFLR